MFNFMILEIDRISWIIIATGVLIMGIGILVPIIKAAIESIVEKGRNKKRRNKNG